MPANSLAVLTGLALDCAARQVLGDDVQLRVISIDEANTRVRTPSLVREIGRGAGGLVGLVGVQTNQFPRALDLARQLRAAEIPVCIGGFHVSGCVATLPQLPPELREAQALGISLFAGEAEGGRLDQVLRDAAADTLAPLYNLLDAPPSLISAPLPFMPARQVRRTGGAQASFDAGRGCPFSCRFCTIINVQGRVSRHRSADDVEEIVRAHLDQGIRRFFISDDNFARNRSWRAILERLAALRREHVFRLVLQVDTACHRLDGFIELAAAAGVKRVFIGLESINPANLDYAGKGQNRIEEYREMLLAWRRAGVVTAAGYIVGFPNDTPISVVEDVRTIQRELPIDLLSFLILTPLPGSREHLDRLAEHTTLDDDLNRYDLCHATAPHPTMSPAELEQVRRSAYTTYYSDAHIVTLMRRARASGLSVGKVLGGAVWFAAAVAVEKLDPLDTGLIRRQARRDRRPGLPIEPAMTFYRHRLRDIGRATWLAASRFLRLHRVRRRIEHDPEAKRYTDQALQSSSAPELVGRVPPQ
jgi:hypothetical protein